MGYETDFYGTFKISPKPKLEFTNQVNKFGEYWFDEEQDGHPDRDCQWYINDEGELDWEGENFYDYVEWLQYLIDTFFQPSGYKLNGKVKWQGEDWEDRGIITIKDNEMHVKEFGNTEYEKSN